MEMESQNLTPHQLLPHKGKMLLIDEIVEISAEAALSRSLVRATWPLVEDQAADALLIVELVAQTSGLSNGYSLKKREGAHANTKGWVVGIKKAQFYVERLPVGAWVMTRATNRFKFDEFVEIEGDVRIGDTLVGEVVLQVMKAA